MPKQRAISRHRLRWDQAVIADYAKIMDSPGVVGIGIGAKETGGKLGRSRCVKIYVIEKSEDAASRFSPFARSTRVLLPIGEGLYRIYRLPTDVVEQTGMVPIQDPDDYTDPLRSGAEIGTLGLPEGTAGCVMKETAKDEPLLVTAGHVVQREEGPIIQDRNVYQPRTTYHRDEYLVGTTQGGFVGSQPHHGGYVDAGLVAISGGKRNMINASFVQVLPEAARIASLEQIQHDKPSVHKFGAATGYTCGRFSNYHQTYRVPPQTFHGILEFKVSDDNPPSAGGRIADQGDSGALVFSRTGQTTGMVVALATHVSIDRQRLYGVPFERIARRFHLRF